MRNTPNQKEFFNMPQPRFPHGDLIRATGRGAPSRQDKVNVLQVTRAESPEMSRLSDEFLIAEIEQLREGLQLAKTAHEKLREVIQRYDAPPWYPAIYMGPVESSHGPRGLVLHATTHRVVGFSNDIDPSTLQVGDEVHLCSDLRLIMARSIPGTPQCGETAVFERHTADGRIVLRWRDEDVVVRCAGTLAQEALRQGELIRWDRNSWLAYERIPSDPGRRFLLDEVPAASRGDVGGQDTNLDLLLSVLTALLVDPPRAQRYMLNGRQSVLMIGPPGCGKTLLARIAVAEIARVSGTRCRFAVVKPAEWEDPYVGVTQQNIRNCFKALYRAAEDGYAVLFLDEVESIGRIRGTSYGHHSDKFLDALLAEIDGFADRSRVAIIAATNRKDLMDPALVERLSDVEIHVRRPDMRGAQSIFGIHLPPTLPYAANGVPAEGVRQEIVDRAIALLYGPNEANELCTLRLRDGKTRTVAARELASGRCIEQICRAARRTAFLRDMHSGDSGIRVSDIEEAVSETLERMASTLTTHNARVYLPDLPQDIDVVSVEPIRRRIARPGKYLRVVA